MKNLFTLTAAVLITLVVYSQSPLKMSYQCVIRNSSGALVTNKTIGMKISILQGTSSGSVVFSETYNPNPQTNANGLVTVEIGSGISIIGSLSTIDWESGPYFIKTETDPTGGTTYSIVGTSQLLSVPYALYSSTAGNGFSGNYDDLTNKPVLFNGLWESLTGIPAGFSDGVDNIDDADNDPLNEIQTLSISGSDLSLSKGGGTVVIPGDNWGSQVTISDATLSGNGTTSSPLRIAQQSASSGQILKWNGTTWAPSADLTGGFTLPYDGSISNSGTAFKITNTYSGGGRAIWGFGTAGAGGVIGESTTGTGVLGVATSSTGVNLGVVGHTYSSSGIGVTGSSFASSGTTTGVKGYVASASGFSGHFTGGKFYVQQNAGFGTTSPSATLDVEGTVQIGAAGKIFSEIREITGTTAASGSYTSITFPSGYTKENTRVLSAEINYNSTNWNTLGMYYSGSTINIGCSLAAVIYLHYPDVSAYWSKSYRILLLKVQ